MGTDASPLKSLSALLGVMCTLARGQEDNPVLLQGLLLVPAAEEGVVSQSLGMSFGSYSTVQ